MAEIRSSRENPYGIQPRSNWSAHARRGGAGTVVIIAPRPPDIMEVRAFTGDASVLDYCALPTFDGDGPSALDLPKTNTVGCHPSEFPLSALAD